MIKSIRSSILYLFSLVSYFIAATAGKFSFSDAEMDIEAIKQDFEISEIHELLPDDKEVELGKDGVIPDKDKPADKPVKDKPADDPKDKKDTEDKSGKNKAADEKPYKIGAKSFTQAEIDPLVEKEFEGIITDFKMLSDDQKEAYRKKYIDIEFGRNRDEWMKTQGRKDQDIAKEKEAIKTERAALETKANDLIEQETRLKAILDTKADTLDDDDKKMDLKMDQRDAQRKLDELQLDKVNIVRETKINYFKDQVIDLAENFPELKLSDDYIAIMKEEKDGKRTKDDPEVQKGYLLLEIINKATIGDMKPVDYYRNYKFNYAHLDFLKNSSTKDKASKDLDKKLEKTKDKQNKSTSGTGDDADKSKDRASDKDTVYAVKGNTREEKLKNLMA